MKELKQQYTIIVVTHNMQQATRVSDRTAFFYVLTDTKSDTRTGVLVEYGPTEQIFQDPADDAHQGLRHRPDGLSRRILNARGIHESSGCPRRECAAAPGGADERGKPA